MLCSESTVISVALSQLQILILQRDDLSQAWASKTDIFDAFEMSLNGCMVVFSCLEAETRQLQTQMPGSAGKRVWTKIKFMWNQDRLKELLTSLRGQQSSINFLLQVLEWLAYPSFNLRGSDVHNSKAKPCRIFSETFASIAKTLGLLQRMLNPFDHGIPASAQAANPSSTTTRTVLACSPTISYLLWQPLQS